VRPREQRGPTHTVRTPEPGMKTTRWDGPRGKPKLGGLRSARRTIGFRDTVEPVVGVSRPINTQCGNVNVIKGRKTFGRVRKRARDCIKVSRTGIRAVWFEARVETYTPESAALIGRDAFVSKPTHRLWLHPLRQWRRVQTKRRRYCNIPGFNNHRCQSPALRVMSERQTTALVQMTRSANGYCRGVQL
jgi:hypothetical protein